MKVITQYECEICKSRYWTPEGAEACEARGVPPEDFNPVGLVYEHNHNGPVGIFAVAKIHQRDHFITASSWAVRYPGYPKYSLGEETCGNGGLYDMESFNRRHTIRREAMKTPEFKEMIEYLEGLGITPTFNVKD